MNGLPSKNTMMIFLVSTIAYRRVCGERKFLFIHFSLLFSSLLHMTKAIFCPLWSLLIYCCLFPPFVMLMPLRTHGKDSRVEKKTQQPKSKLRELLGYFSCVARESVDGRRIHLWGSFFFFFYTLRGYLIFVAHSSQPGSRQTVRFSPG